MKTRVKLTLLSLAVILAFSQSSAQKYKLKRGKILRDKEPVGIVVGETDSTLFTVMTLDNQEVMKVTQGKFKISNSNPFLSNVVWYNVTFSDTGNTLKLDYGGNCGLKCVFKHIIFPVGIPFNNTYIANQDDIFSKNDISESLNADTIRLMNEHRQMLTMLNKAGIKRNRSRSVQLRLYNKEGDSRSPKFTYHILQGAEIVGKIIKTGGSFTSFEVYKKLAEPTTEGQKFVPLGKSDYASINLRFTTISDGKIHRFDIANKTFIVGILAKYVVKNNYL